MLSLVMAWSPAWRSNARRFEVHHPGDYATLNSNQHRDETSNPNEALSQVRIGALNLVLVGTGRFGLRPLDPPKAALGMSPTIRWAIISASDTRTDILASLAAGFHGFISKRQSDANILAAIANLLSGRIYVPPSLAESGELDAFGADLLKLTTRQREVLSLLARGKSNKEIARAPHIAEATAKIHMAALLRALGVRNRTEAAYRLATLLEEVRPVGRGYQENESGSTPLSIQPSERRTAGNSG